MGDTHLRTKTHFFFAKTGVIIKDFIERVGHGAGRTRRFAYLFVEPLLFKPLFYSFLELHKVRSFGVI